MRYYFFLPCSIYTTLLGEIQLKRGDLGKASFSYWVQGCLGLFIAEVDELVWVYAAAVLVDLETNVWSVNKFDG